MRLSAAAAATRSAQDYEAMRAGARVVSEIPGVDASMVVVVAGGRLDLHVCQGGTAMGSSVGTSDRAYSKRLFYVSFRSTIHYFGCSTMRTRMCRCGVGHVSFIDRCSVSRGARISRSERIWGIRQSIGATRVSPLLKGNAMLISSVLFSCKSCICVGVEQKYSFQFICVSALKQV